MISQKKKKKYEVKLVNTNCKEYPRRIIKTVASTHPLTIRENK